MKRLALNSQVKDYAIKSIIESREDKNTYIAEDYRLDKTIVLSEYDISKKKIFEKFLGFRHPSINTIEKIFEENEKLYVVSKLLNTQKLETYLLKNSFTETEINTILNSLLDVLIRLKSIGLSMNLSIDNFNVNNQQNIIFDNSFYINNHSNDEKVIYELGSLVYSLITKSSAHDIQELKANTKYSRSLCSVVNRILNSNSSEKFKDLTQLKDLVKQKIKSTETNIEPIVHHTKRNNVFSRFMTLTVIFLLISASLYVMVFQSKTLKASEVNLAQSLQFHIAAYMDKHEAQYILAEMYEKGYVVDKDDKESIKWYKKAAKNNNVSAQLYLGYMYQYGKMITKDIDKAIYWYEISAKTGNKKAQYYLGHLYYLAKDTSKDIYKSIEWLEKAAAQNYEKSFYLLGYLYLNSDGEAIDYKKSFYYFSKGLDSNDSYSVMAVAYMYYNGYGIKKDISKAMKFYEQEAFRGNKIAEKRLEKLKRLKNFNKK